MNFSSHYSHRHIIDFHHCQLSSKPESLLISIVNLLLNIKATAVTVIQRVAGDEYQTDNGGITLGVRCHSLPDELTNAFHTINDGNTIYITSKVQLLKIKWTKTTADLTSTMRNTSLEECTHGKNSAELTSALYFLYWKSPMSWQPIVHCELPIHFS